MDITVFHRDRKILNGEDCIKNFIPMVFNPQALSWCQELALPKKVETVCILKILNFWQRVLPSKYLCQPCTRGKISIEIHTQFYSTQTNKQTLLQSKSYDISNKSSNVLAMSLIIFWCQHFNEPMVNICNSNFRALLILMSQSNSNSVSGRRSGSE